MSKTHSARPDLKKKAAREARSLLIIFLYLAFFLCAVATYRMLLLNDFQDSYSDYGAALINALVIAKVILIGDYAHLGKKQEARPLLLSALNKAFLFGLLVFGFHLVEEAIKRLMHGEHMSGAFHNIRMDDLLARTIIIFCTFIPLFGFMELRRVLGEDKFHELVFRKGTSAGI